MLFPFALPTAIWSCDITSLSSTWRLVRCLPHKIRLGTQQILRFSSMLSSHQSYTPFSPEIWSQIAWQVEDVQDLLALSATCRFLRLLCTDDQLWKQLCIQHYGVDYTYTSFLTQYKACTQDKSMRRVCRHLMGFTQPILLEKSSLYKTMSLESPCSKCHALCNELYMCMHRKCDEACKYLSCSRN